MPEEFVECPNCGEQGMHGTQCIHCGEILPDDIKPVDFVEFGFDIKDMDDRQQTLLFADVEMNTLDARLDKLIENIRSTRQALELPSSDKVLLAKRTQKLQRELKAIKARRRQLVGKSGELQLSLLLKALEHKKQRLDKLKESKDSIEKEVFKEEQKKIESSIKGLKERVDEESKITKKWIKGMERNLKALNKELTRLEAQLKIGDVSVASYESRRNEIDRKIKIIQGGMNSLNELLDTVGK